MHTDLRSHSNSLSPPGSSLDELNTEVEEINYQIKQFIASNTDSLVATMSDFSKLADRYSILSSSADNLTKHLGRLRREALDNYQTVKYRTAELERIHCTSIALRLLRQFVHAKSQLGHQYILIAGNLVAFSHFFMPNQRYIPSFSRQAI